MFQHYKLFWDGSGRAWKPGAQLAPPLQRESCRLRGLLGVDTTGGVKALASTFAIFLDKEAEFRASQGQIIPRPKSSSEKQRDLLGAPPWWVWQVVWCADLELPTYIAFTFLPNTKATWATCYSWISQGMRHLVPGTQSHLLYVDGKGESKSLCLGVAV